MHEHRSHPVASRQRFTLRVLGHLAFSVGFIALSLLGGMEGYRHYEHMAWRDAFLNAAMLLGGMGPIATELSDSGKVFAGFYALYSGLGLLVASGVVVAPLIHRVLHSFHFKLDDQPGPARRVGDSGSR